MRRSLFLLSLLTLATLTAALPARASTGKDSRTGTWSQAANLAAGREEHTATLLRNGNVLVVGGTDGRGTTLATAEIYDPRANRWRSAGSMRTARLAHTATLLSNGKVLVVGGIGANFPSDTLASTETYDPASNGWSTGAPMNDSRARHTATLLSDGRVLVVGGLNVQLRAGGLLVQQPTGAEVYDPKTGRWSATTAMALYRLGQTATRLLDGRVLVTGSQDNLTYNSAEVYDPQGGRWTLAAPMASGRSGHNAVLLAHGEVLVVGGISQGQNGPAIDLTSAEVYHPATNRWSAVASMSETHSSQTATVLGNGRVLVLGATGLSRPEVYDPVRNAWSVAGPWMNRYQHTATRLTDGEVLVVGGYGLQSLSSVLKFDPSGVTPSPPQPTNTAVVLVGMLCLLAAAAWSMPPVRRRVRALKPGPDSEEWINP